MNASLPSLSPAADAAGLEELWLLGQPRLADYLHFVRRHVVDGEALDRRVLCDEWRDANDYYYELEEREAGIADGIAPEKLPRALAPLARKVMADGRFKRAFDTLPAAIAMVPLDRLIVSQPHATKSFVDRLKAQIGPAPSPEALFRFCLPLDREEAPVRITPAGSRRYLFSSESTDLRFHEARLFSGGEVPGYAGFGPVAGILGLVFGFGSNFLSAVSADGRLLLQNGHHRACALMELGVPMAPCIIESVTRTDELALTVSESVGERASFYFRSKRPPILKDFLDPRIRKVLPVKPVRRTFELTFEVKDYDATD